jgi:hypothetical protein
MTFEPVPMRMRFHGHRESFQPPLEGSSIVAAGLEA